MGREPPITAILCVRNEEGYLRTCLERLVRQGIRLAVIDNASDDGTAGIIDEYSGHVLHREWMPWDGSMDLAGMLEAVAAVAKTITKGWIVHQAPDEALDGEHPTESLRDAIDRIDRTEATVINFDEFVFLQFHVDRSYTRNRLSKAILAPVRRVSARMRAWTRNFHVIGTAETGLCGGVRES